MSKITVLENEITILKYNNHFKSVEFDGFREKVELILNNSNYGEFATIILNTKELSIK